ncbi:MAG: hypothetical protein AB7O59_23430 [Pirellulales bacterium]
MNVLSDTSPLNYLILIGHADILGALFGRLIVPAAVCAELQHPRSPAMVRNWIAQAPSWLLVQTPVKLLAGLSLGRGETELISLAVELGADLLLIDDRLGRRAAKQHGLMVAGTISVLDAAAERNLINLGSAFAQLRNTNFHVSDSILARALLADSERRKQHGSEP